MPWIIYGTAWKKQRTADLVVEAVQAGFCGIDTACQPRHYNEAQVGEALVRLQAQGIDRGALYLQTKFTPVDGQDPRSIPYDRHERLAKQIEQSFRVSLCNLQTSYIDTLILHSPFATHEKTMEAWLAMEALQAAGGVGQLGISNCYALEVIKALYADAKIKPAILQNRFYEDSGYDQHLRKWCGERGIVYQSFWTLTANPHKVQNDVTQKIAGRYGRSVQEVFFRYLTQSGIVPLTGTSSIQHMRADLSIMDFTLSFDEMKKMRMLLGLTE